MIRLASSQDLLGSFRELDRSQVELPEGIEFPMLLKDFISWSEPSGHRLFVVFEHPDRRVPLGLILERESRSDGPAMMCEFCHSVKGSGRISLLTAAASRNRRVGLYVCRDLECREGTDPSLLRERSKAITRRIAQFARQNLF